MSISSMRASRLRILRQLLHGKDLPLEGAGLDSEATREVLATSRHNADAARLHQTLARLRRNTTDGSATESARPESGDTSTGDGEPS